MTNNSNNPQKQHTVQKAYLEYFTNQKGMLNIYDIKKQEFREQPPDKTTINKNFYTFKNKNGKNDYSIEIFLGKKVENDYNNIISKIYTKEQLNINDKQYLSRYIAYQYLRTPIARRRYDLMIEEYAKQFEKITIGTEGYIENYLKETNKNMTEYDIEKLRKIINAGDYKVLSPKENQLKHMLDSANEIANILIKQNWYYIKSVAKFITCDNPVAMFKSENDSFYGGGVINSEKTFPLTPDICLFINKFGTKEVWTQSDENLIEEINKHTAFSAEKYLIANEMNLLENLILKIRGKS